MTYQQNDHKGLAEYVKAKGLSLTEVYKTALNLYVNWTEELDIGYDNFPDEYEKYKSKVEKMDYIEGLEYIAIMEAIEQLSEEGEKMKEMDISEYAYKDGQYYLDHDRWFEFNGLPAHGRFHHRIIRTADTEEELKGETDGR